MSTIWTLYNKYLHKIIYLNSKLNRQLIIHPINYPSRQSIDFGQKQSKMTMFANWLIQHNYVIAKWDIMNAITKKKINFTGRTIISNVSESE